MSRVQGVARVAVLGGVTSGFFLLACCGATPTPTTTTTTAAGPCGLTDQTRFPDDPKFVPNLGKFTPPPEPSADELDGDCRAVWQTVVEEKHCGDVVIPAFCAACTAAEQPKCTDDNGRGRVMQRCREESLPTF